MLLQNIIWEEGIYKYKRRSLFYEDGYYEVLEFNSIDSSAVGDTLYYSNVKIELKNDSEKMKIDGKKLQNSMKSVGILLMRNRKKREMRMRDE